ncbi:hypothetical protein NEOLEDRAFT_1060415, partial [Neolentinus lepideus HHB14362 ss-1]
TRTVGSRTVYHETQCALRSLANHVQTEEQLQLVLRGIERLTSLSKLIITTHRDRQINHSSDEVQIRDPPVINRKGRPQTARFTSRIEGPPRGGGPNTSKRSRPDDDQDELDGPELPAKKRRRCGLCKQHGHNRTTCRAFSNGQDV